MYKKSFRPCPICQMNDVESLHTQEFIIPENVPLPDQYDVVCCESCNFVFADTPHNEKQYEQYYQHHSKYELNKISLEDNNRHADTLRYLLPHLQKNFKILDLGCGNGELLRKLKKEGFHFLTGIDPSPGCTQHLDPFAIKNLAITLTNI